MLKKNGSYIWIHDIGKKIATEDGRDAVLSVCYDITSEKEHERFLKGIAESFNGDIALIAVDLENKRLIPTYVSDNMGRHEGISKEEFLKRNAENSINSIYTKDRLRVWNSICDAVQKDATPSISFRVLDRSGKAKWLNASFSGYGEHDGMPVVLAVVSDSTIQNDLQLHIINQNGTGIAVIDADTHEVYFANDAIFRMLGSEPTDYTNKFCPDMLASCGGSCENCGMHEVQKQKVLDKTLPFNGKWLSLHAERREWNGKSVVSIYAGDVTQQHLLEQQVADEDAQLQGILKNMACGVCVSEYDSTGKAAVSYVSDVFLKMCEADRETVIQTFEKEPFYGVIQEDVHIIRDTVKRLIKSGGTDDITYRFKTFCGRQIWIHAYFSVQLKADGGCTMYFTCVDVTEKLELQNQLQNLVENMPSAVCLYRWDGNRLHRLMAGYGYEGLCGKAAVDTSDDPHKVGKMIVHPDDFPALQNFSDSFLRDGNDKTGSYQYRIWNDEKQAYIWISAHGKLVKQADGTTLLYSVYTDETEQVELTDRLAETRSAINAAVQYGQLGIWIYDLTTENVLQNLAEGNAYGYDVKVTPSPEHFITQKIIHPEDAELYRRCYREIHDGAQNSDCVVRIFNIKMNEYRWMHIYLVRQPDGQHTGPKAIGMSFDIHREITSYEKLSKAQTQLKQEKQVVDDLFKNLPGGVVLYRWDGENLQPLYVSNGFSDLYGKDENERLLCTNGFAYEDVHPDDLPGLQAFFIGIIEKDGENLIHRYRIWNKQRKEYLWIQLSVKVEHKPDGTSVVYANYADVDAEVKAAGEVLKEEKLLETTCRLAHIWMFQYHLRDNDVVFSKGLQEGYHLPPTMKHYSDEFFEFPIVPEESHALFRQMLRKVENGEDATTEMKVRSADGTYRNVRFEWHVTRQEAGKPVEVAGLVMDISKEIAERRKIEKEREKLLGGDKNLVAYSITDLNQEIIVEASDYSLGGGIQSGDSCSEFAAKITKLLLDENAKKRCAEMRDPKYAIRQYNAGITEWTEDMRWKTADEQIRWRRSVYSIIENVNAGTLYLYCYLYDVTDEKVALALFSGIRKNLYLRTGVISFVSGNMYDFEGDFTNRKLKTIDYETLVNEYAAGEVLPEDAEAVRNQGNIENVKKQLASGQKDFAFVHRAIVGGKLRYYQIRYALVPGKSDMCISVIRDITDLVTESEQKNAVLQKALTAAKAATQAKSEFLSRMSHEIRTPMNAIMGMTAIAQDNKSDFLQVTECLSKIESSGRYLLTLINDILEMSRIESGKAKLSEEKFVFAGLIDQVRAVAEPLAKKSEVRLEIINDTSNGSYYGDTIRIQQVLINLLGNALKFTKKFGHVRFMVTAEDEADTKTNFVFTVEDTGIGMSEEFMKKMFEPFTQEDSTTTSKYGGSGLGLAISKNLVEAMNGTITAESIVGIGTSFTVTIPLNKVESTIMMKEKETEEMSELKVDAILKDKRILMVEDHPLNIMVAKRLLERKGILITVAENGQIAVDAFRGSATNEYDAILMDIRMPVMDGLEATRQIRATDRPDAKTIPIIAMTANALEEDRKNSAAAGMNEHLSKPIDPNNLYQTIAKQIAKNAE